MTELTLVMVWVSFDLYKLCETMLFAENTVQNVDIGESVNPFSFSSHRDVLPVSCYGGIIRCCKQFFVGCVQFHPAASGSHGRSWLWL